MADIKQRVFIITQGLDGGVSKMSTFLSKSLIKNNKEVFNFFVGRKGSSEYANQVKNMGGQTEKFVTGSARSFQEIIGLIKSIFIVNNAIKKFKPDLIIYNGHIPLLFYFFLAKNISKIFYDHGRPFSFIYIKKILTIPALYFIDAIISVAEFSAEYYRNQFNFKKPVKILINCVDTNARDVNSERSYDNLKILMASRIDFIQKDPITLVKATIIAKKAGIKIRTDFAGDGPNLNDLKKFIKDEGADEYIRCLGHIDEISGLRYRYNISCLSSNFESFGLAIVEGMGVNHLCIGSNVWGINDVIINNKNGLLFQKGNYQELANMLIDIFRNSEKETYRIISGTGYADAINRYSPVTYEKSLLGILSELDF